MTVQEAQGKQRCNHCMAIFSDAETTCPECGRDDALMFPYEPNAGDHELGARGMTVQEARVIYIMACGAELMDKIRREANCWADGDENICLDSEQAMEIPELAEALKGLAVDCDVIVSE